MYGLRTHKGETGPSDAHSFLVYFWYNNYFVNKLLV